MFKALDYNPTLLASNAAMIDRAMAEKDSARAGKTPLELRAKRREMFMAGAQDEDKANEYAALRREQFSLDVLPDLFASQVMELRPLLKDERIQLRTRSRAGYIVHTLNQHAMPPQSDWTQPDSITQYDPYKISTDEVFYPVDDIIQGNLYADDQVNEEIDFDWRSKIDSDAWTVWTSSFGSLTSGVYSAHSRIGSGNLPTSNIVDSSAEGGITLGAVKDLMAHVVKLPGGRRVRNIYVSPQDIVDIWDWTPISNATGQPVDVVNQSLHQQIQTSGVVNNIFGYQVNWVVTNTLTTGKAYVTTNYPSGYLYYKPDYERTIRYGTRENRLRNKPNHESVVMEGVIKPIVFGPQKLNSIRWDFV